MMGHNKNKETTIEKIIEDLPSNISFRVHKLNYLTETSARGYLIKESSKIDLRKKNLMPSYHLTKEFEEYLKIPSRCLKIEQSLNRYVLNYIFFLNLINYRH